MESVRGRIQSLVSVPGLAETGSKFVDTREWSVADFRAVFIGPDFDWYADRFENRNWLWHLHQLSLVNSLISYDLTRKSDRGRIRAIEIVHSWVESCMQTRPHPVAWHDHASALRARNVLNLLFHCVDSDSAGEEDISFLVDVLRVHGEVLAGDDLYSKGTNHGFDQSIILYELANELGLWIDTYSWLERAASRLNHEIASAFASDGGHVENSPAYVNYGIKQVVEAVGLGRRYQGDDSQIRFSDALLADATRLLYFLVRPDGKLPLIGDTSDFVVRDIFSYIRPQNHAEFLYSIRRGKEGKKPNDLDACFDVSGWAVMRSDWGDRRPFDEATHIVLKCGYLSNYHRHDDDSSFVLFAFGEEWLVDGGVYKYDNKDRFRNYFRSANAHNISMPAGERAQRQLVAGTCSLNDVSTNRETSEVFAVTRMFRGFEVRRHFRYDRGRETISIRDSVLPVNDDAARRVADRVTRGWVTYVTRFVIPGDKAVRITDRQFSVELTGRGRTLSLVSSSPVKGISVSRGKTDPVQGWISRRPGVLEEAFAVEFLHADHGLDNCITLAWK